MKTDHIDIWIKKAYRIFALNGQEGLKIERLAKEVGKSKSSFYHHFADLDLFIDTLLEYHLDQLQVITEKENQAQSIDPDLINIFIEHKIDFLFYKQLLVNKHQEVYQKTLLKSNKVIEKVFEMNWVNDINPKLEKRQIDAILSLIVENFLLQNTVDNMNYDSLSEYFTNLKKITTNLF
ncbi:TetR/AcrR family transcriptional regulator [Aquiflexum lacus]|uniref:TetR/AcrR family transcriptional regulator n=1 Tax=Aquiflexum lacus TaxID=2483805 RepID=UPI001894000A|nr:TetR/AcrR family transcriptional regulator [Aquiflexum lacus]